MHRVFVYGTLKRGFPNFQAGMKDFPCIGRCRTVDACPLVVGGRWHSPYLIPERGVGYRVYGDVFEVDAAGLATLDRMEGAHLANGYRRISVGIENPEGGAPFDAWTYVKDRDAIDGIYSDPMQEYELDPEYVTSSKRTCDF